MSTTIYTASGIDFEERVLYENNDGTVKDLTGYTSNIKVAKYFNSTPIITITGVVETPPTSGIVKYSATKESLSVLGFGSYFYSRYLYDSEGEVKSVTTGNFVITPSVG